MIVSVGLTVPLPVGLQDMDVPLPAVRLGEAAWLEY